MKHFKLTNETIKHNGTILYRIKSIKDFYNSGVLIKAGTKGGFVEKEDNLSGNAWIYDDAKVYGNARVFGNTILRCENEINESRQVVNITGLKHNITVTYSSIHVGCMDFTIDQIDDDFSDMGLTDDEVSYIRYTTTSALEVILAYMEKQ